MKSVWQLQDAKARFSELVECALSEGPQHVTRRGVSVVVVISEEEYRRSLNDQRPQRSLVELMQQCPTPDVFERIEDDRGIPDEGRDIGPF